MRIDTTYNSDGETIVHFVLKGDDETSLTDDLLARIGANQHRLEWSEGHDGIASLAEDPATLRLPLDCRNFFVRRIGDRATVTFKRAQAEDNKAVLWALAASIAVAFGAIGELRYNAAMTFHPLTTPTLYTTT